VAGKVALWCKIKTVEVITRGEVENMAKIDRDKIVRSAVGSARLEGYKGSLKAATAKKADMARTKTKSKVTVKQ
jgi:hypothetical protein